MRAEAQRAGDDIRRAVRGHHDDGAISREAPQSPKATRDHWNPADCKSSDVSSVAVFLRAGTKRAIPVTRRSPAQDHGTIRRFVGAVGGVDPGPHAVGLPSNRARAGNVFSLTAPVESTHGHAHEPKKAGLADTYRELGIV